MFQKKIFKKVKNGVFRTKNVFFQNLEFQIYCIPICIHICMCYTILKLSFILIQSHWYIFGMQVENHIVYLHKNKQKKKFKWTKTEFDRSMRNYILVANIWLGLHHLWNEDMQSSKIENIFIYIFFVVLLTNIFC